MLKNMKFKCQYKVCNRERFPLSIILQKNMIQGTKFNFPWLMFKKNRSKT